MENSLTIIVPAYNEEKSLEHFLPELLAFCEKNFFQLIVVNDGSSDKTQDVLEKYRQKNNFSSIKNKINKGYGGAIKAGIAEVKTKYLITIDADGQHYLEDIEKLYQEIISKDADMIVGNRKNNASGYYRSFGKWLIRNIAKILMPLKITDINSGMKIYTTDLAKKYIRICPDSMAYSDIIALTFISQKQLVLEIPIQIKPRTSGTSTISTKTAFETLKEILNIVVLFNPMRIFFPLAFFFIIAGIMWGFPIVLIGKGISVGAMVSIISGIIFFFFGLIAEQISSMRKENLN
ncbi:MAG: glycosyltransferase family 2 protein [Bacteroidia bacterium]